MPIYEQTYRKHDARGPLSRLRFWPITREALVMVLKRRAYIGLMILAALPMVVRVIQVYIVTQFEPAGRILALDATLFGKFLNQQIGFAILLSVFGGAGLIANDLRTGAILVYLSRPLTRRDYVLGKLCVLLAVNLAVTLVPGIVLYATALSLAPAKYRTWELAWVLPAIALHSLVISLVVSLLALAVSALSKSARLAGLGFVILVVGLEIVRGVVRNMTRVPEAGLISLQADLRAIGAALFGFTERGLPPGWALPALVLATAAAVCLAILRRRVRAVEVVS
jgi:ABC-2 type transport system permease protein